MELSPVGAPGGGTTVNVGFGTAMTTFTVRLELTEPA